MAPLKRSSHNDEAENRKKNASFGAFGRSRITAFMHRPLSLRMKLALAFLLVSLLPLALLSLVNAFRLSLQLRSEATRELVTSSQQVKTLLDTYINDQLNLVYTEAQLPEIRELMSLSEYERSGSELESNAAEVLTLLRRKKSSYTRSYALLDLEGKNILDTETANIGQDESDKPYFTVPLESGLPYISEVLFDRQGPNVYFSSAVWDKKGQITGILRVKFNAQIIYNLLMSAANQFNAPEMYAVLVDDEYFIRYAHSRDYGLMYKSYDQLAPDVVVRLQSEGRLPAGNPTELVTNQTEMADWLRRFEQEPIYTSSSSALGGERAISTAVRLQRAPWIVITRQPTSAVMQPVRQQTRLSVLLSLLAAMLVVGAALGATQVLSAPIVRLTEVAKEVAGGNISNRARVEADDEIGALASAFNSMTDELQHTLQDLEKRVADRTRAIELSADISRRLSNILDPSRLVAEVVELIQSAFDYYHVQIYLFDDQREHLLMVGGSGEAGKQMLDRGHKLLRGQGLVGRCCDTGASVIVPDTHQEPQWLPNPLLPETKSEIAVPILLGDQVLGALDVQHSRVNGLGLQDVDLLTSVANQVAIALRNARQFEQIQRFAEKQTRMNQIIQQIQSTKDIESALQVAVREIGRAMNAQRARVRIEFNRNGES